MWEARWVKGLRQAHKRERRWPACASKRRSRGRSLGSPLPRWSAGWRACASACSFRRATSMAQAGAPEQQPMAAEEEATPPAGELLSVSLRVGACSALWEGAAPGKEGARVAVELAALQGDAEAGSEPPPAVVESEESKPSDEGTFDFGLHVQTQRPLAARERMRQQLLGAPTVLTVSKGAAPIGRAELNLEELVLRAECTRVECELALQAVPPPEGAAAAKEWVELAEGACVQVQVELSQALTSAEEREGAATLTVHWGTAAAPLPEGAVDAKDPDAAPRLALQLPTNKENKEATPASPPLRLLSPPASLELPKDAEAEEPAGVLTWASSSRAFLSGAAVVALRGMMEAGEALPLHLQVGAGRSGPSAAVPLGKFKLPGSTEIEEQVAVGLVKDEQEENGHDGGGGGEEPTQEVLVGLRLALSSPLTPPWEPPRGPSMKPSALIPPRAPPAATPRPDASAQLSATLTAAARQLAVEYKRLFSAQVLEHEQLPALLPAGAPATRARELAFQLNYSGQYFRVKQRVQGALRALVQDKYPQLSAAERHQLYAALMEQLSAAMATAAGEEAPGGGAPPTPGPSQVPAAALAAQYELWGDPESLELARRAHLKGLSTPQSESAAGWHAYALFALRGGELGLGEECLREALAMEPQYSPALLALALLALEQDRPEEAEVLAHGALEVEPQGVVAWGVLALVSHALQRPFDTDGCLSKARALAGATAAGTSAEAQLLALCCELRVGGQGAVVGAMFRPPALLQARLVELAEGPAAAAAQLSAHLEGTDPLDLAAWLQLARLQRSTRAGPAELASLEALMRSGGECDLEVSLSLARLYQQQPERAAEALGCYQKALSLDARQVYAWLGCAACYAGAGSLKEAEQCLAEASYLDYSNPLVWARLALLCQQQGRTEESAAALQEAFRHSLVGVEELLEMAQLHLRDGSISACETILRRVLSQGAAALPSPLKCRTYELLAQAFAAQHLHEEALANYQLAVQQSPENPERSAQLQLKIEQTQALLQPSAA